jgi:hypothetical protein
MKKSEIIFRPNDFYDALERIFGSGAVHLQSLLMNRLNEKMRSSCMVVQLSDFFAAAAVHDKNAKC